MPKQVQFRRGNKTQNDEFTGATGEISINQDSQSIRVHDGSTVGGFELARANLSNVSGGTTSNIGIGTTNPTSKLHVVGDARITGILTVGNSSVTINGTTDVVNVGSSVIINGSSGAITATSFVGDGSKLSGIVTSASGILTTTNLNVSGIGSFGNVQISSGIITASSGIVTYYGDGSKLSGISSGGGISGIAISTNVTNSNQYITYVTSLGSTTGLGVTSNFVFNPSTGNLGIGTISPTSRLHVQGDVLVSGIVTASSFVGNVTGNLSGTASLASNLTGNPNITVTQLTATRISAASTTGTTGQILQSTGTGIAWTTAPSGVSISDSNIIGYNQLGIRSDNANGRLEVFGTGNFRVFTAPGTFVVNPGISSIRVRVVGAGGNGGNGAITNFPTDYLPSPISVVGGGGGGGGGGYAHKVITSFTTPRSYAITVGSAPGGTSSFGSEVSATGGSNGSNGIPATIPPAGAPAPGASGGAGGTGSGGNVNFTGATGISGNQAAPGSTPFYVRRGYGGSGGAAATQKGNGSGSSVSGLPSFANPPAYVEEGYFSSGRRVDSRYINRFPFDIFNGSDGTYGAPINSNVNIEIPSALLAIVDPTAKDGYEGGSGKTVYNAPSLHSWSGSGGNGGTAGGGGGGASGEQESGPVPPGTPLAPTVGGAGGAGGYGGGGGGGGGTVSTPSYPTPAGSVGSGGVGGNGIVIVEW